MLNFYLKMLVYLLCFVFSMYGLSALNFNKLLKANKVSAAWILYFLMAFALTYLVANFLMNIIYYFN